MALLVVSGGEDFDHIAAHAECAALKLNVAAVVLDFDKLAHQLVALHCHAGAQGDHHAFVLGRIAHRINAGNGRDDDDVPTLAQSRRCAVAQAFDFLVDGGVLFNIGIGRGDIGFRLIVVIIGNEILDRTVRKEFAEFRAKLCGKRLVVRDDECRTLDALDDGRHRIGFARACDAQQNLARHARTARPAPARQSPAAGRPAA